MLIGVLGSGRMARIFVPALLKVEGVTVAIGSRSQSADARRLASLYDVPLAHSDRLLAARVDGVVIATATTTHPEYVAAALDEGIPTFCEKPLAFDPSESERLAQKSDRTGVPLVVGFQRRFDPVFRRARGLIALEQVPVLVRLSHLDTAARPATYDAPGGMPVDQCVHDMDAAMWVTGQRVVEIVADARRERPETPSWERDAITARLTMSGGSVVEIDAARNRDRYTVGVEVAPLHAGDPVQRMKNIRETDGWSERFASAFECEMRAFVDLVRVSQSPLSESPVCESAPDFATGADATEAVTVAWQLRAACTEMRPIRPSLGG